MDPALAARLAANDRKVYIGLGIATVLSLAIFAAFLMWRVSIGRSAWFERDALMAAEGVETTATAVAIDRNAKQYRYDWEWSGRHYEGNLGYCSPFQGDLVLGATVPLRVVQSRPHIARCDDSASWRPGPPSYWSPLLLLGVVLIRLVALVRTGFKGDTDQATDATS